MWASRPGPAMPRSIGRLDAGAWTMTSQQAQAFLRRIWQMTLNAASMSSSCSDTSSPSGLSLPPQAAQACSAGSSTRSSRGRCAGSGWRTDLCLVAAGSDTAALSGCSPSSASRSSRRVSSCSICRSSFSDLRPNCMRRSLASCSLSCSISSERTLSACSSVDTVSRSCCSSPSR
jgi:hypothetical protein